jgi:hypothetical protein
MKTIEKYDAKPDWYLLKAADGETVLAAGSLEHCKGYAAKSEPTPLPESLRRIANALDLLRDGNSQEAQDQLHDAIGLIEGYIDHDQSEQPDKATPRPWAVYHEQHGVKYIGNNRETAATVTAGERQTADVALILQAVNSYDALVAVAEAASLALTNDFKMEFQVRIMEALAALAAVRGQEGAKS